MNLERVLYCSVATIGLAALSGVFPALVSVPANAQQAAVAIDNDDVGGVVRGPAGQSKLRQPGGVMWLVTPFTPRTDQIR